MKDESFGCLYCNQRHGTLPLLEYSNMPDRINLAYIEGSSEWAAREHKSCPAIQRGRDESGHRNRSDEKRYMDPPWANSSLGEAGSDNIDRLGRLCASAGPGWTVSWKFESGY